MILSNDQGNNHTKKSVRVLITGRVQRVWFRGWTAEQATGLGLQGWVRNLSDGRVEAVFSGHEADVDTMIDLCWQGPRNAEVEAVTAATTDPPAEKGFQVWRKS